MPVKSHHPDYEDMASRWKQCRDACAGEWAVHRATTKYLPKFTNEEQSSYDLRLKMTPFFNASWRTVAGLKGMLFRKPPKITLPPALEEIADNIDGKGSDLVSFLNEIAEESLIVGRVGVLVDYPEAAEGLTLADTAALNLRTIASIYKTESIINWRTAVVNGMTKLVLVVLTEQVEIEGKDEFEVDYETHYRVLDLFNGQYRQRVFRVNTDNSNAQVDELLSESSPKMAGKALDFIPMAFIGVDCNEVDIDAPPLIDLITTNFKHYGQATSYERGCFFSGLPTLFTYGYNPQVGDAIYIGGTMANNLPDPSARAEFVEVKSGFQALRQNLEDKKAEMAILGARMLEAGRSGGAVEAAETVARRSNGEESILSDMAQTMSHGAEMFMKWVAQWQGVDGDIEIEVNRDFIPVAMDSGTLTALVSAWQSGAVSAQTLFDNLVQGEIISDSLSFEEEQERISSQQLPNLSSGMMQQDNNNQS
jgi:hypothetical protein